MLQRYAEAMAVVTLVRSGGSRVSAKTVHASADVHAVRSSNSDARRTTMSLAAALVAAGLLCRSLGLAAEPRRTLCVEASKAAASRGRRVLSSRRKEWRQSALRSPPLYPHAPTRLPPPPVASAFANTPADDFSVAGLTDRLRAPLDRLQTALSKPAAPAPSQRFGDPAAGRALALMAAGVDAPDKVEMETPALREHLLRLFGLFSTATRLPRHAGFGLIGALPGPHARMHCSASGSSSARRSSRAARCRRRRRPRLPAGGAHAWRADGAGRLLGRAGDGREAALPWSAQSAAFHRLLREQLLPWMLQLQHALASGAYPAV